MIGISVWKRGGRNVKFNRIFQNGVILFNGFCSDCCSVRNWRLYWCEGVETERERIDITVLERRRNNRGKDYGRYYKYRGQ